MSIFKRLDIEQREAVGLLQIGTFLEYFDLMLYVHMAVLLNELFFPHTDPDSALLLSAFSFCSTFVLRPFGALLFGYIGDHIGRKATVVITTFMMAVSCLIMANLPTYAQIGIAAAWGVTICRIIQGLSALGEIIGADLYLTEITDPPERYPIVSLIGCASSFGGMAALGAASLFIAYALDWRLAFWFGALIALVGGAARTRLKETIEFADMKRRMKKVLMEEAETHEKGLAEYQDLTRKSSPIWGEKVNTKTVLAYFLIACSYPACFYFSYVYCGNLLKSQFGYTSEQVIHQNLLLSIFQLLAFCVTAYLSYRIHPLKIVKARFYIFFCVILFTPLLLNEITSPEQLFLLQVLTIIFASDGMPAVPVFLIHFPIFKRFTYVSFMYALSRALIYIVTSFGLVYLMSTFGDWGIWILMVPLSLAFYWGIRHYEKLEFEGVS